jgi:hypothetical protein
MSDFNITLFEACELLNRSKKSISRYIRRGLLHPEKVKSQQGTLEYRFSKADIEALIDRMAEEAYENGELLGMDVLGNTETIEPIVDEMFTGEEKPLDAYRVISVLKHLQGKVLTVVDATFSDEKRIKYVKDLMKDCFSQSSNWLYEMSIRDFEKVGKHQIIEK